MMVQGKYSVSIQPFVIAWIKKILFTLWKRIFADGSEY